MPPIHKILRTNNDLLSFDTHYELDVHMAGETTSIGLREKFPGALEEQPLLGTIKFAFPDTPEGIAARQALEALQETGTPAEIPGVCIETFSFPIIRKVMGVDPSVETLYIERIVEVEPIPVDVTLRCVDGDAFSFRNTVLNAVQAGDKEITLSNEHQPGPAHVVFVANYSSGTLDIRFPHEIVFPIRASTLYNLLWLRNCLSKPWVLKVVRLDDGTNLFSLPDKVNDAIIEAPSQGMLGL
jgi:hypothetical protein